MGLASGRHATEEDAPSSAFPRTSEQTALAVAAQGVRASVVRLSPSVHGDGDHGFVPRLIAGAREKGFATYVGDGHHRWPGVHRLDAARLYRLALEKGTTGARYHGVADEGVLIRDIAEVIGRRLNVPAVSKSPEEAAALFGFIGHVLAMDTLASSAQTQERLGWRPSQNGEVTRAVEEPDETHDALEELGRRLAEAQSRRLGGRVAGGRRLQEERRHLRRPDLHGKRHEGLLGGRTRHVNREREVHGGDEEMSRAAREEPAGEHGVLLSLDDQAEDGLVDVVRRLGSVPGDDEPHADDTVLERGQRCGPRMTQSHVAQLTKRFHRAHCSAGTAVTQGGGCPISPGLVGSCKKLEGSGRRPVPARDASAARAFHAIFVASSRRLASMALFMTSRCFLFPALLLLAPGCATVKVSGPCGGFERNVTLGDPVPLLGGKLSIRPIPGLEPGEPPGDFKPNPKETHLLFKKDGSYLGIYAVDLFRRAGPDMAASVTPRDPVGAANTVLEPFSAGGVQGIRLVPTQPVHDGLFKIDVLELYAVAQDGLVASMTFSVSAKTTPLSGGCTDLARAMAATLAAGPRRVDLTGGPRPIEDDMMIDLPPDMAWVREEARDYVRYTISPIAPLGARESWFLLFRGNFRLLTPRIGAFVPGWLLGVDVTWLDSSDGVEHRRDALVEIPGSPGERVHVVFGSSDPQIFAAFEKMAGSLRLVPRRPRPLAPASDRR